MLVNIQEKVVMPDGRCSMLEVYKESSTLLHVAELEARQLLTELEDRVRLSN